MKWLERLKLKWRLSGLRAEYEDLTGPEYMPPNACCPDCANGGRLDDIEVEIENIEQALKALK